MIADEHDVSHKDEVAGTDVPPSGRRPGRRVLALGLACLCVAFVLFLSALPALSRPGSPYGGDLTVDEIGGLFLLVVAAAVGGVGALLSVVGWALLRAARPGLRRPYLVPGLVATSVTLLAVATYVATAPSTGGGDTEGSTLADVEAADARRAAGLASTAPILLSSPWSEIDHEIVEGRRVRKRYLAWATTSDKVLADLLGSIGPDAQASPRVVRFAPGPLPYKAATATWRSRNAGGSLVEVVLTVVPDYADRPRDLTIDVTVTGPTG